MEERLSKSQAMSSMDNNIKASAGSKEEYEEVGHDAYFEKYQRLQGLTKEQFEVCKRKWGKETFDNLYRRESDSVDNF